MPVKNKNAIKNGGQRVSFFYIIISKQFIASVFTLRFVNVDAYVYLHQRITICLCDISSTETENIFEISFDIRANQ